MVRPALLLVLTAASACSDEPTGSGGPDVTSHVESYDIPGYRAGSVDVLIVVDNSTAMAGYQGGLAALASGAEAALSAPFAGALPDVHLAVTTTDASTGGAFQQPANGTESFLANTFDARFEPSRNFTGALTDALAGALAVGATSNASVQPLEAARLALDAHPDFVRDHSLLGVLTIAATDDASGAAVGDYATALKARKTDPAEIVVNGIYDLPATRLDAFHALFPNRNAAVDIATADFGAALGAFTQYYRAVLGVACKQEPLDVDPSTPGAQYDCDLAAYYDDGSTETLRACTAGGPARCFEFVPDPGTCTGSDNTVFTVRGYVGGLPHVKGQCVVAGL